MTVLRMPNPTKRNGSDNWYFRRRIPADIQRILGTLPRAKRPRCWHKTDIWISLGTADRAAAKAKCPEIAARVEQQVKALREGPKDLTAKQLSALSGLAYKAFAENLEADPILSAAQWREVAEANREASRGDYGMGAQLGIFDDDAERRTVSMEARFGRLVDGLLTTQGVFTTDKSRWRLIEMFSTDLTAAAEKLARNDEGDYSPDEYAKRFPVFARDGEAADTPRSLTDIATAWYNAALASGTKRKTANTYRKKIGEFAAFLKHDDAHRITRANVLRWGDQRAADGISAVTIKRTDFAAFGAVFAWAVDRGLMPSNPATRVSAPGRARETVRDRFFSSKEASAILKAARAVVGSKREAPTTTAAKRWVPWLCAYSGARVTEMVQLRKQDVRELDGHWFIRLTPEAGNIKTGQFRVVPIHDHLIEEGFLAFVQAAKEGPLFCNVGKDGTTIGPAEGVGGRIRAFVRVVVKDTHVQPNHAWRYTFKTLGFTAGIEERTLDGICGHAPSTQGRKYIGVEPEKMIEAMERFPRYRI